MTDQPPAQSERCTCRYYGRPEPTCSVHAQPAEDEARSPSSYQQGVTVGRAEARTEIERLRAALSDLEAQLEEKDKALQRALGRLVD